MSQRHLRSVPLALLSVFAFGCAGSAWTWIPGSGTNPDAPSPVPVEVHTGSGGFGSLVGGVPEKPTISFRQVGSTFLEVEWTTDGTAVGFKLVRYSSLTATAPEATFEVLAPTTTKNDSPLVTGRTYCYEVKAYNANGESPFSDRKCQAPVTCQHTIFPVVEFRAPVLSPQFSSVDKAATADKPEFRRTKSSQFKYFLDTSDACATAFSVVPEVLNEAGTVVMATLPTQNVSPNAEAGATWSPLPIVAVDTNYRLRITVRRSDLTTQTTTAGDGFLLTVKPLPADTTAPTGTATLTGRSEVCAQESTSMRFTFTDASLSLSPYLGDDWIHSQVWRSKGVSEATDALRVDDRYSRSFSYYMPGFSSNPSADEDYYFQGVGYDYAQNGGKTSTSVMVRLKKDVETPSGGSIALSPIPVGFVLEAGKAVTLTVSGVTDDCSRNMSYEFYFLAEDGSFPVPVAPFRGKVMNGNTASFTPGTIHVTNVGETNHGQFLVRVYDVGGHTSEIRSDFYRVIPNLDPVVGLTVDPLRTFYGLNEAVTLVITLADNNPETAALESLTLNGSSILPSPVPAWTLLSGQTAEMRIPWHVPATGGWYTLQATVRDDDNRTAGRSLSIQAGQQPTFALSIPPGSYQVGQTINLGFSVTDNNPTSTGKLSLSYAPGLFPTTFTTEFADDSFVDTYAFKLPATPGWLTLKAVYKDVEGYTQVSRPSPIYVANTSADIAQVLVLDMNHDGSMNFDEVVYFDMDLDHAGQEFVNWLNDDDGFLMLVVGGIVDNVSDFATVAELGGCGSTITGTALDRVQVWIDADSDGVADSGELRTLSAAKITEVRIKPISEACAIEFDYL